MNATAERLFGAKLDLRNLRGVQDPKHKIDRYEHVPVPPTLDGKVIYTKIEGDLADTHHMEDKEWLEVYTGLRDGFEPGVRGIYTQDADYSIQGIPEDAGLIVEMVGTCSPDKVAIDSTTMEILTEPQAQLREDTFGASYPRYNLWEFRIARIIKTDGPERTARLMDSAEEQRAKAEEASFGKMGAFFDQMLKMIEQRGGAVTPEAAKVIADAGKKMEEEQREEKKKEITPDQKQALEDWELVEKDTKKGQAAKADVPDMELKPSKRR